MNKTLMIVLVCALLLFVLMLGGGAAAYYWYTNNSTRSGDNNKQTTQDNQEKPGDSAGDTNRVTVQSDSASIKEFLQRNDDMQCTYTDNEFNGKMYFSKGRVRADYTSNDTNGGMIIANEKQYVWDNETKTGVVFDISELTDDNSDDNDDFTAPENSDGLDLNREYDFDCKDWKVDVSFFTAPSDIEFSDFLLDFDMSEFENFNQQ